MYKTVLVPLDGSELAECVLPHVEEIVFRHGTEALILLRALEPLPTAVGGDYIFSEEISNRLQAEHSRGARAYLEGVANRLRAPGPQVTCEVVLGPPATAIADYAAHHPVDLIIMATHGRSGMGRWLMGSVADRLLHASCAPVLLVRGPGCVPRA